MFAQFTIFYGNTFEVTDCNTQIMCVIFLNEVYLNGCLWHQSMFAIKGTPPFDLFMLSFTIKILKENRKAVIG